MCSTPSEMYQCTAYVPNDSFRITYRVKATGELIESNLFSGEFKDAEKQAEEWIAEHLKEWGEVAEYSIAAADHSEWESINQD